MNESVKKLEDITQKDIDNILEYYYSIEDKLEWKLFPPSKKVCGVQKSNWLDTNNDFLETVSPGAKTRENTYTTINPIFKGSLIEDIINRYKLSRTRLVWLGPLSNYGYHKDLTPRIHIPLLTNNECFFIFDNDEICRLPVGGIYKVDTTKNHGYVNLSRGYRLHLFGVVEN